MLVIEFSCEFCDLSAWKVELKLLKPSTDPLGCPFLPLLSYCCPHPFSVLELSSWASLEGT